MVVARRLLQVFQSLFAQRNGYFVSALRGVLYDQIVKRSQASWYFVAGVDLLGELRRRRGREICRGSQRERERERERDEKFVHAHRPEKVNECHPLLLSSLSSSGNRSTTGSSFFCFSCRVLSVIESLSPCAHTHTTNVNSRADKIYVALLF